MQLQRQSSSAASPLRTHLVSCLPDVCGVIPPLALIVADFLEGPKYPEFPPLPDNFTPSTLDIAEACSRGLLSDLQYIITKQGASVNDPLPGDSCRHCPLHIAAWFGQMTCLQYLLFKGANPHTRTADGLTALHLAASHGLEQLSLYLLHWHNNNNNNNNNNHNASSDISRLSDSVTSRGLTLIHAAAEGNSPLLLRVLVREYGLDPNNTAGHNRSSPLHRAVNFGCFDAVRCLVDELGIALHAKDEMNQTSLQLSKRLGKQTIEVFLRSKMNNH